MKSSLISLSRRWIAEFFARNRSVKLPATLGGFELPFKLDGIPPTRIGIDRADESPFYESRFDRLYGYYTAYRDSRARRYRLLYADILAIASGNIDPIYSNGLHVDNINIELKNSVYRPPINIHEHAAAAIKLFKDTNRINYIDGAWENNYCFSLSSFDAGTFVCRRANYFDQVATNIALDWDSGLIKGGGTIRNNIENSATGALPRLQDSCLANTIGTAVMVFNAERRPIVRIRNPAMGSIPQAGFHPSVSGVLEVEKGLSEGKYSFELFASATKLEILREMGLEPRDYKLYPIAFARELPRGGKPQIFWIALTNLDDSEIDKKMRGSVEYGEFINSKNAAIAPMEPDEYKSEFDTFTYEGLASFLFSEEFLDANSGKVL